ncbi:hypothetical protein FA13DRAFT_1787750 [Coprinellus micaceus]|uniref:Uncharacterized protein n=1 Tax=Coprinellus micaceus TaxID=71717 RepID=A0A4Y7TQ59_COPMI|nr:hypothetical protein FA13DRAFT_1787750 [Coprinellus micaceus]
MVREGKARQKPAAPTPMHIPPPEDSLSLTLRVDSSWSFVSPTTGRGCNLGYTISPALRGDLGSQVYPLLTLHRLVISRPTSGVFKFPVVVVCVTLEQAQDVNQINEGIAEVRRKRTATMRITVFRTLVDDQVTLGGTSRRWYGAWHVESRRGSVYQTIFAEYTDYCSIVDAAEVADGRQHCCFKDIQNAMTWFLAEEVHAINPTIINLINDKDEPEEGFSPLLQSPNVNTTHRRQVHWEMAALHDTQHSPNTLVHPRTPYEHRFTPSLTPTPAAPPHARATSPSASRIPLHCFTPALPPPASCTSARPTSQFLRFGSVGPSASAGPSASRQHLPTTSTAHQGGFCPVPSFLMPHAMVDYLRAHDYEHHVISSIQ